MVIINGKESDREVVNALNPERIESVSVIGPEKAIKIYGEKAKDGVMDIKLYSEKKFAPRKIEIEGINKTRLDALNSGAKSWGATPGKGTLVKMSKIIGKGRKIWTTQSI